MGGGEVLWCSQILQLLDGQPTNWKILHRGVSLLDRVLSPGAGSAAWGPGVERRSPGALGCEGQRVRSCKDWGKGDSTLGECPWGFTGAGTQAKQWLRRNPARHICGCGGSPGEAGSAAAHGGARTPVAEAPGSIHRRELSEATVWAQSSEPAQEPAASSAAVPQARQPAERGRRPRLSHRPSGVPPSAALPRTHWRGRAHRGSRLAPPRVGGCQPLPPGAAKALGRPGPPRQTPQQEPHACSLGSADRKPRALEQGNRETHSRWSER